MSPGAGSRRPASPGTRMPLVPPTSPNSKVDRVVLSDPQDAEMYDFLLLLTVSANRLKYAKYTVQHCFEVQGVSGSKPSDFHRPTEQILLGYFWAG